MEESKIYGDLVVHCSGNIKSECDFKKEYLSTGECVYNKNMECQRKEVFDILVSKVV